MKSAALKLALRLFWRCLPHRWKPANMQTWHTCTGDAVIDYYWRWHWLRVNRGVGLDGQNWECYRDTYGSAWYDDR